MMTLHDDIMFYKEKKVTTLSLRGALHKFLQFLSNLRKSVVLLAHNGIRFDTIANHTHT